MRCLLQRLVDAAALDTAIIVGCGEPFDPSTIPYDILEFHLQGGGRAAAKKVKKQLQDKRQQESNERADTVRASGHGLDSKAAITSRYQNKEEHREQAAMQRQEYMEQLMYRAAQQKDLMDRVHHSAPSPSAAHSLAAPFPSPAADRRPPSPRCP